MSNIWVISNILLWVIVLIQMIVIFYLIRYVVEFLNRFRLVKYNVEDIRLKIGQQAPFFRTRDKTGNLVKLADNNGLLTLMCFVSDSCESCIGLLKEMDQLREKYQAEVRMLVVTKASADGERLPVSKEMTVLKSDELFFSYHIQKTPTLVLIDTDFSILAIDTLSEIQLVDQLLERNINNALTA